jgi:hypothetical protein
LKAWACVIAFSVRLRQSRMSSPKKRKPTLPGDVEVLLPLVVHEVEVVARLVARDVDVLAQLDVALGAEDDGAAVAPGAEAVRREPVDADVVRRAVVADQRGLAEVLELRRVGIGVVADGGLVTVASVAPL